MRKVRIILCLFIIVMLCACGDSTEIPAEETPRVEAAAPTEEPAPAEDTVQTAERIELNGEAFPTNAQRIALTAPVDDLAALADALQAFPECRSVELTRSFDPLKQEGGLSAFEAQWSALAQRYPDVSFSGGLLIGGVPAETLETYAVAASADPVEEIRTVVSVCPALAEIDLTKTAATSETVAAAEQDAENIRFLWTDAVYGASASDTETLAFSGAQDPDALCAYLACFPALKEVDLRETTLSEEQQNAVSDRFFDTAVRRTALLNGAALDSFTETLDLSGAKIGSYETFADEIGRFPKLKKLELHDCSLSNEQIAAIRDRYPSVEVVWTVRFNRWEVRTDAVAFSTQQSGNNTNRQKTSDVQVLRYCRDLIALDLGHNDISDLAWIEELQNLQVLILADNRRIKDVTSLGTLSKLKYLELFLTGVEDISPLANLSELLDVNLCYAHIHDVTPLLSCTKLERIWLGEKVAEQIGKEGVQSLETAFPDAEFDFVSAGSTKRGWREHPRFFAFRRMFEENVAVEPFLP